MSLTDGNTQSLAGRAGLLERLPPQEWLADYVARYVQRDGSFRTQVVKSAKLHFVDTGVASYLLGIREPAQLRTHPLRGALFES